MSDPTLYRSRAGVLQYLRFTRPDISYVVQQTCLHMHDPRDHHFHALKRIIRYVQGTLTLGLYLHGTPSSTLMCYTNADWAGCPDTRRLTSGYCVYFCDYLISCMRRDNLLDKCSHLHLSVSFFYAPFRLF